MNDRKTCLKHTLCKHMVRVKLIDDVDPIKSAHQGYISSLVSGGERKGNLGTFSGM